MQLQYTFMSGGDIGKQLSSDQRELLQLQDLEKLRIANIKVLGQIKNYVEDQIKEERQLHEKRKQMLPPEMAGLEPQND